MNTSSYSVALSPALTIEQVSSRGSRFEDVLRLRAVAYAREQAGHREPIDEYSLHFVARQGDEVLGALRVTCRCHGPLESEEFYPQWLLDGFGGVMSAASRMCVTPALRAVSSIPLDLTRFAWSVVLPLGVRIDVSKARLKAIPYYLRMGYFFVRDSAFSFDRWNARCGLIAFPANPQHNSKLSDVFRGIDRPCELSNSVHERRFTTSYRGFLANTQYQESEDVE